MGVHAAPFVGVPAFSVQRPGGRRPVYGVNQTYMRALLAAGLTPLMIPPGLGADALEALCAGLDGLLLAGGSDIDPQRYGEERLPECEDGEPERDDLELALTRMALARDLPTFGICRGMQVMNVACGGALVQDIPSQRPKALPHQQTERRLLSHVVMIEPGSRMHALLGADEFPVNSLHHQAVSRPGDGLRIVGWAPDGVAEALEAPDKRFAIAVQYHPEELYETDAKSLRLFEAFAQACRER